MRKRKPPAHAEPPSPPMAYSIKEFCRVHGISQDMFFKMKREGWGPVVMKVGHRTLISAEAAAEWRRQREQRPKADCNAPVTPTG